MKIKHRVLKDFPYIAPNKKIITLEKGTILTDFTYEFKEDGDKIKLDRDIIDNNPDFFLLLDWRDELHSYIKVNKFKSPKTLAKKLEPFIDEMIISSMEDEDSTEGVMDKDRLRELEDREYKVERLERELSSKEDEIKNRNSRLVKRESDYKEDLKILDSKEDKMREDYKVLKDKELDLDNRISKLKQKERDLDKTILESSNIDEKYEEFKSKMKQDTDELNKKEEKLQEEIKLFNKSKQDFLEREEKLKETNRDLKLEIDEFNDYKDEIEKLDAEIRKWEKQHWKLKRMNKPPSSL